MGMIWLFKIMEAIYPRELALSWRNPRQEADDEEGEPILVEYAGLYLYAARIPSDHTISRINLIPLLSKKNPEAFLSTKKHKFSKCNSRWLSYTYNNLKWLTDPNYLITNDIRKCYGKLCLWYAPRQVVEELPRREEELKDATHNDFW